MKSKHSFSRIIALVLGFVFIISGYSKALNYPYFQSIVQSYNVPYAEIIAIAIILVELFLGLILIFDCVIRYASIAGIILLLLFSSIYSYGHFYLGIKDCGCFGNSHSLNSNFSFFIVRNIILLIGLIWIYRSADKNDFNLTFSAYSLSIMVTSIGLLMSMDFFKDTKPKGTNHSKTAWSEIALGDYLKLSKDSTYMISILSYDCPHCINSMGNLMQYKQADFVDEVICVFTQDNERSEIFNSFFNPNFKILELPPKDMDIITDEYPVTYFVKNDTIVKVILGEIPSGFFFKENRL